MPSGEGAMCGMLGEKDFLQRGPGKFGITVMTVVMALGPTII